MTDRLLKNSLPSRIFNLLLTGIAAVLALGVAGCATTGADMDDGQGALTESRIFDSGPDDSRAAGPELGFELGTVYFEFDRSKINQDAQLVLKSAGSDLMSSDMTVVMQGHCDEVGWEECNLAFGEWRAISVRNYLYDAGVPMERMDVVTYGEARPAVRGEGEEAWRLNRRAEISARR